MSDERFDEELRSVLIEDSPRHAPDDLRRRVGAIPATHATLTSRRFRPAWRRHVPLWIGALVMLAVVAAVGFWRFGPDARQDVGDGSSASPTIAGSPSPSGVAASSPPPASSSASATPPASADLRACVAAGLHARILGWQGAAGSRIADVEITNQADHACIVRGTPQLQLVDADGRVLLDSATAGPSGLPHVRAGDPVVEPAAGGSVRTQVAASNYCGSSPTLPIDIVFTLADGGSQLVATPAAGVSSALAVPPCLGSTAGSVSMNGWRQ